MIEVQEFKDNKGKLLERTKVHYDEKTEKRTVLEHFKVKEGKDGL